MPTNNHVITVDDMKSIAETIKDGYKQKVSADIFLENIPNGINVRDYGATGDGDTDDSQAFSDAISAATTAGKTVILIPRGTYNLNNVLLEVPFYKYIGEDREECVILNSGIQAFHGIDCENLTFDGGTQVPNSDASLTGISNSLRQKTTPIFATPKYEGASVIYKNCEFRNVQIGTMCFWGVTDSSYPLNNLIIENCYTHDCTATGLYFSVHIVNAEIKNNVFKNIGNPDLIDARSTMLTMGDTSNNTDNIVDYGVVEKNIFDTHVSAYDMSGGVHTGCCYLMDVECNKVIILNNQFKNMVGFGLDKEGLYTKGNDVEIAYNEFYQCCSGEAYVCCKTREFNNVPNRHMRIHHNTFTGEWGEAIRIYGAGIVHDNYIAIKKMRCAIRFFPHSSSNVFVNESGEVYNNHISSGIGQLYINGTAVDNFDPEDMIYCCGDPMLGGFKVINNYVKIVAESGFTKTYYSVIKVQNVVNNVEIKDNITYTDSNGSMINLTYSDTVPSVDTNIVVDIENNYCNHSNSVTVDSRASTTNTHLKITYIIKNNIWVKPDTDVYALNLGNASCTVYYESTQPRTVFSPKNHIYIKNSTIYTTLASNYVVGDNNTFISTDFKNVPTISVNPQTTTATLTGLTINGVSYAIEGGGGDVINDSTPSLTTTYSSTKIEQLLPQSSRDPVDLTVEYATEIANYNNAWEWVQARLNADNVDDFIAGDYIPLTLTADVEHGIAARTLNMEIMGINTYDGVANVLNPHIDWCSREVLPSTKVNPTSGNNNGTADQKNPFLASEFKQYLDTVILPLLPNEVRAVIKDKPMSVEERYDSGGVKTTDTGFSVKTLTNLWVPSEAEIFGHQIQSSNRANTWGIGYPLFNKIKNRMKYLYDGTATAKIWLELNAYSGANSNWCTVTATGSASSTGVNSTAYYPICFRTMKDAE